MFDHRELVKLKIDRDKLPADSVIINTPEEQISKNRGLIFFVLLEFFLIVFIFYTILKRGQAERVLKLNEERFRALFEKAPMAYHSQDIEGKILEINPAWLKITGYKREDVIGAWFGSFMTAESLGRSGI